MKYGYARVSTAIQELEVQLRILEDEGCERIFREKYTGAKTDRPEFTELLAHLEEGDTLVATKLDRLARNTEEGIKVIRELFEKGVKVHILNLGLLEDTPTGRFFLQTLLAVAELERSMIIERMAEGKAIAMLRDDYVAGRPKKFSQKKIDQAVAMLNDHSYKMVEELTGISKSTLVRAARKARVTE